MEAASPRNALRRRPTPRGSQPRNAIPRDRAVGFFGYVAAVVGAAIAGVALSISHLPDVHHGLPASFWVIAALAVIVDIRPFNAPGPDPDATVFSSIAFTFALQLVWGL